MWMFLPRHSLPVILVSVPVSSCARGGLSSSVSDAWILLTGGGCMLYGRRISCLQIAATLFLLLAPVCYTTDVSWQDSGPPSCKTLGRLWECMKDVAHIYFSCCLRNAHCRFASFPSASKHSDTHRTKMKMYSEKYVTFTLQRIDDSQERNAWMKQHRNVDLEGCLRQLRKR